MQGGGRGGGGGGGGRGRGEGEGEGEGRGCTDNFRILLPPLLPHIHTTISPTEYM